LYGQVNGRRRSISIPVLRMLYSAGSVRLGSKMTAYRAGITVGEQRDAQKDQGYSNKRDRISPTHSVGY